MSESPLSVDAIVVGAGHAGLAVSRCLQREGIPHLVLERGQLGASWRARWDSFHLNTPNQLNLLPDGEARGERDGFLSRDQWIAAMEDYRAKHGLPIRTGIEVRSIERVDSKYEVRTQDQVLHARSVVLCTGNQNVPRVPDVAKSLPADIEQLHSDSYREASQLPAGAVLVVGSAQTGGQIAEDLLEAGRDVWLCTSKVGRAPRRYRGRDITEWIKLTGMAEQRPDQVPAEQRDARQPMISGTHGGHSLSLQLLGRKGARLLGRLLGVTGRTLQIGDDLLANVEHGNTVSRMTLAGLDAFIEKTGIDAPAAEPDPADLPCDELAEMAAIRAVDLDEAGIRSVIWATGFSGDFSYLPGELLDERGEPRHTDGVCAPGLYCLGLTWLRTRISGLIPGVLADAEHIAERIGATLS